MIPSSELLVQSGYQIDFIDLPGAWPAHKTIRNILTIDVEDWFHVTNFSPYIDRKDWQFCQTRIQYTLPRLLDLMAEYNARATFFVLGWVAKRFPGLVRMIREGGHEIASHGQNHRLLMDQTPDEFMQQLRESKDILEQISGMPVLGHRAPSYSLRKSTDWAIPILSECGFEYDSSIFSFGLRSDPEWCELNFPFILYDHGPTSLVEYPLTVLKFSGHNIPVAGGGYFRLLPYPFIQWAVQKTNRQGYPAIMYLHPWEFDADQPRVKHASWLARFRHYHHLDKTETKFRQLLSDFKFYSIRDAFWSIEGQCYEIHPQTSIFQTA